MSFLKRSIKYLLVVLLNALILFSFALYLDDLPIWVDGGLGLLIDFLRIGGITLVSLLLIYWMVRFINRFIPNAETKVKMLLSVLIAFLLSFSTYENVFYSFSKSKHKGGKELVLDKIHYEMANPIRLWSDSLSFQDYEYVRSLKGFREISEHAENISFHYRYEDFIPDHSFEIKYEIPDSVEIELIHDKGKEFERKQTFELIDEKKVVKYSEMSW